MNFPDILAGIAMGVSGAILYYRNYRNEARKWYARAGILLMLMGAFVIVGPPLFNAAYNSR